MLYSQAVCTGLSQQSGLSSQKKKENIITMEKDGMAHTMGQQISDTSGPDVPDGPEWLIW